MLESKVFTEGVLDISFYYFINVYDTKYCLTSSVFSGIKYCINQTERYLKPSGKSWKVCFIEVRLKWSQRKKLFQENGL